MTSNEATLSFDTTTNQHEGIIKFTNIQENKSLRFTCKTVTSGLSFSVPKKFSKFKIQSDFFDILVNVGTGETKFKFKIQENQMSLFEMRDAILLESWFSLSSNDIEITLKQNNKNNDLKYIISTNAGNETHFSNEYDFILPTITNALTIAHKTGLELQIKTTIEQLMSQGEKINYISLFMHTVLDLKNESGTSIDISGLNINIENTEPLFIITTIFLKLGIYDLIFITSIKGNAIPQGLKYTIHTPKMTMEHFFESENKEYTKEKTHKLIDEIIETNDDGNTLFIDNLRNRIVANNISRKK
ncbi:hypothetical protein [Ewingella americana]